MNRCLALALALMTPLAAVGAAHAAASPEAITETATRQKLDPRLVLVADALGMVRLAGNNETLDLINRAEFSATGKAYTPRRSGAWASRDIRKLTFGLSYRLPASRVEIVQAGASGAEERSIQVFRDGLAWNETELGVGASAVPASLQERRRQVFLLPHGFMRAVLHAPPGSVKITTEGGKTVVTAPVDGVVMKATIGARNFPERIEMPIRDPILGLTTLAANYSDYKDWQGYEVFFPEKIVQTLGGRPLVELTVTSHETGPYLIWPIPSALSQSTK